MPYFSIKASFNAIIDAAGFAISIFSTDMPTLAYSFAGSSIAKPFAQDNITVAHNNKLIFFIIFSR